VKDVTTGVNAPIAITMTQMWIAPLVYALASVLLWQFAHVFFMPAAITAQLTSAATDLLALRIILTNVAVSYFGAYGIFAARWPRLKPYFRSEFFGALALWAVNVLLIFPLIGRGILGYKLPQGAFLPCFYLAVTHWVFARALQMAS